MSKTRPRKEAIELTFATLKDVMGLIHNGMREALGGGSLSPSHVFLMRALRAGEVATPKDLAHIMRVTPATITGLLNKLETEGLVARERKSEDRRVVHVRLTREGEARIGSLSDDAIGSLVDVFEGWSTAEIETLQSHLARLVKGARKQDASRLPRGR